MENRLGGVSILQQSGKWETVGLYAPKVGIMSELAQAELSLQIAAEVGRTAAVELESGTKNSFMEVSPRGRAPKGWNCSRGPRPVPKLHFGRKYPISLDTCTQLWYTCTHGKRHGTGIPMRRVWVYLVAYDGRKAAEVSGAGV